MALSEDIDRAIDWWIEQLCSGVIESHNPDCSELDFPLTMVLTEASMRKPADVLQYVSFYRTLRRILEDRLSKGQVVPLRTDHFKPIGMLMQAAAESGLANVYWPEHVSMDIAPTGMIIVCPYYGAEMQEI